MLHHVGPLYSHITFSIKAPLKVLHSPMKSKLNQYTYFFFLIDASLLVKALWAADVA